MTGALVFLDTETTSLRPDREAWEVAMIRREDGVEKRCAWFIRADLSNADSASLKVGQFYERSPQAWVKHPAEQPMGLIDGQDAAGLIEEWTRGAVIVGSNPAFDLAALDPLLRFWGLLPSWHYRPVCVATLAAGHLLASQSRHDAEALSLLDGHFRSYAVSEALGIDPPAEDVRHTAMGDAEWTMRLYDALTTIPLEGWPDLPFPAEDVPAPSVTDEYL